MLSIPLTQSVF